MLLHDFPNWLLVYYYYHKWVSRLDFNLLLERLRGHVHVKPIEDFAETMKCGRGNDQIGHDKVIIEENSNRLKKNGCFFFSKKSNKLAAELF